MTRADEAEPGTCPCPILPGGSPLSRALAVFEQETAAKDTLIQKLHRVGDKIGAQIKDVRQPIEMQVCLGDTMRHVKIVPLAVDPPSFAVYVDQMQAGTIHPHPVSTEEPTGPYWWTTQDNYRREDAYDILRLVCGE